MFNNGHILSGFQTKYTKKNELLMTLYTDLQVFCFLSRKIDNFSPKSEKMMVKWFIGHLRKEYFRSPNLGKNTGVSILIGFFIFILIVYMLALGLFLNEILLKMYPDSNPVVVFNGILFYYLMADLMIRYFIQGLPKMKVEAYLHLPIRKSSIIHFMVLRTLLGFFNFLPLFVLIPFVINSVSVHFGGVQAIIWFLSILIMVLGNNFLATYLKRAIGSKPGIVGVASLVLITLALLDYFGLINIGSLSAAFFGLFLHHPWTIIIALLWLLTGYLLHYHFLKKRLYPEEVITRKTERVDGISRIQYFKSLGYFGTMLALDLKMIWRNKRTRTIVYMLPVFLLYGFFFYPQEVYRNLNGMLIFVGVFMTGGMMLNYDNYALAYESNHFDGLLANRVDFRQYFRMKYINSLLIASFCYVLTIPYVLFGTHILLINTAAFFYNIGILSFVLLYMSTYNRKRMDMSRGSAFNYQGVGASNWLAMIPAFLLPVLVYLPFSLANRPYLGIAFIGLVGIVGLLFYRSFLNIVYEKFRKQRYSIAEGFREK